MSSVCEWAVSVPLYHVSVVWRSVRAKPRSSAFSSSLVSFVFRVSWEMLGGNVRTTSR